MVQLPQRPLVRGPTFIRLLARLGDIDIAPADQDLPERLSQWIDWTRAVTLSRALDSKPQAAADDAPAFDSTAEAACLRTRQSLAATIVRDSRNAGARKPAATGDAPAEPDYAPFRQHCLAMQRSMQTATGRWRGRLRDMLGAASPELARLAEVDALMESVLSPREHTLLATVPGLLGEHFQRLHRAAQETDPPPGIADACLERFRNDMQDVLLAELDVRFLPLEGLLAALRSHSQGSHVQTLA